MKRHASLITLGFAALLLFPRIVVGQKTSFDFDNTADFSTFRTYAWREGTPAGEHFLDRRIVSAIDSQLAAKGLKQSDERPDIFVLYHLALGTRKSVSGFGTGSGPFGWHGGLDTLDARMYEIPVGGLVIDVVNASKRELVWRGVGIDEIDVNAKPEKRDKAISTAVQKILRNYPPKSAR